MSTQTTMDLGDYIIIRVTPDQKNYTWWVVESDKAGGVPMEPLQALGNRTTAAATLATAIQTAMPTLGT